MKILAIGDIVGVRAIEYLRQNLWKLRCTFQIHRLFIVRVGIWHYQLITFNIRPILIRMYAFSMYKMFFQFLCFLVFFNGFINNKRCAIFTNFQSCPKWKLHRKTIRLFLVQRRFYLHRMHLAFLRFFRVISSNSSFLRFRFTMEARLFSTHKQSSF